MNFGGERVLNFFLRFVCHPLVLGCVCRERRALENRCCRRFYDFSSSRSVSFFFRPRPFFSLSFGGLFASFPHGPPLTLTGAHRHADTCTCRVEFVTAIEIFPACFCLRLLQLLLADFFFLIFLILGLLLWCFDAKQECVTGRNQLTHTHTCTCQGGDTHTSHTPAQQPRERRERENLPNRLMTIQTSKWRRAPYFVFVVRVPFPRTGLPPRTKSESQKLKAN